MENKYFFVKQKEKSDLTVAEHCTENGKDDWYYTGSFIPQGKPEVIIGEAQVKTFDFLKALDDLQKETGLEVYLSLTLFEGIETVRLKTTINNKGYGQEMMTTPLQRLTTNFAMLEGFFHRTAMRFNETVKREGKDETEDRKLVMPYGAFVGKTFDQVPSSYLKWVAQNWQENNAINKAICTGADKAWNHREKFDEHWEA
jgi:hypothetical protein